MTLDQRGAPRFDGACDSGPFEFGGCPLFELANTYVIVPEAHEACEIHVRDVTVLGPSGSLDGTVGQRAVLFDEVVIGGDATIAIDSNIQVTSALEEAARAGFEVP